MYRRHQRPRTFSDGQEKFVRSPFPEEAPGQAAFPKEVVLMSFDGLVTRAVVHELQDALAGGRVTKIYQPGEYELLFHIRSQGETHRLILSAHPAYPRLHLTRERTDNPKEPPMFCMLLRKHLEGGILHRVEQVEMDRIVHVDIRTRNELGDEVIRRLVVEIMGRHSNVILIDPETETIFDAVRRVTPAVSQYRQVVPGARYRRPPEQNKRHPLSIDRQTFFKSLDFNRGRMDKQLVERFAGLGPLVAREIVHRAGNRESRAIVGSLFRGHVRHPKPPLSPQPGGSRGKNPLFRSGSHSPGGAKNLLPLRQRVPGSGLRRKGGTGPGAAAGPGFDPQIEKRDRKKRKEIGGPKKRGAGSRKGGHLPDLGGTAHRLHA